MTTEWTMLRFTLESMPEILARLRGALAPLAPGDSLVLEVPDPDLSHAHYPGERLTLEDAAVVHRPLSTWNDLAEALGCTLGTPQRHPDASGRVQLRFRKLSPAASWQLDALPSGDPERYGTASTFARVDKLEEPRFLVDYLAAVRRMDLPIAARVLALGVNNGSELGALSAIFPPERWAQMELVGVDHSVSAIADAEERYPYTPHRFVVGDISALGALDLGRFDLVIALNTLQSPAIDGRAIFRDVLSHHLRPGGSLLLGFPNCRYLDHTLVYGAQRKGVAGTELSVLLKEVKYYKRVLHQRGFEVTLTGKYTLLLAGRGRSQRA